MRISVFREIPYAWVVVALCVVASMPAAFTTVGLGVLYPFIQEDLQVNRAELGVITAVMFGVGTCALLFLGWLFDVVGVRRMQTVSLIAAAIGVLLFSQAQSLAHAMLTALLIGVGLSATFPASTKAVMDWVSPHSRGVYMGVAEASVPVSGIIAAVVFPLLALALSWRSALMLLALMIAVSCILFFAFYRDAPGTFSGGRKDSRPGGRLPLVARNRDIWLVAVAGIGFAGVFYILLSYLVLFLKEHLGMSTVLAGTCLAVALAGGAVGRIGWGLVSDLVLGGQRTVILALLSLLSVVLMALMAWLPSDAPLMAVVVLVFALGTTAIGWPGLYAVLIAELAGPDLTGTAIGLVGTVQRAGAVGAAPLFGLLVDRTGSYDMGWWMAAGLAGFSTVILAFLRPRSQHR